jgi:hypothetical protein
LASIYTAFGRMCRLKISARSKHILIDIQEKFAHEQRYDMCSLMRGGIDEPAKGDQHGREHAAGPARIRQVAQRRR